MAKQKFRVSDEALDKLEESMRQERYNVRLEYMLRYAKEDERAEFQSMFDEAYVHLPVDSIVIYYDSTDEVIIAWYASFKNHTDRYGEYKHEVYDLCTGHSIAKWNDMLRAHGRRFITYRRDVRGKWIEHLRGVV